MKKILMTLAVGLIGTALFAQTATEDQVYRRAEKMPVFQECQDENFADAPYRCTIKQLMDYFQDGIQLENPLGAQTKGLLRFVVETDGSVSGIELVRSAIVKTGDEALNEEITTLLDAAILEKANTLSFAEAGEQDGELVRVQIQFSVPVNY